MLKHNCRLLIPSIVIGLSAWADSAIAQSLDACKILQKADVEAAFAPRKFDDGKLTQTIKGAAKTPAVSECLYTSQGTSPKETLAVYLLVRRAPTDASGMTPAQARGGASAFKATPTDVSGLGEGAYWFNAGSAKLPSVQLNVFPSKREWRVFSAMSATDINTSVANLTKIAKASATRQ